LSQSYESYEIIIIDDGSTDNSVDIVNKYLYDNRIILISQENQGVSVARNNGVKMAIYDHIAFIDGDDEWMPEYLQVLNSAIQKYPNAGMYNTARNYVDFETRISKPVIDEKFIDQISVIDFFRNPHIYCHTSASVVKKSVFWEVRGFPLGMKKNEDFALFYSIALVSPVVYCGQCLSCYYGNIDGQSTKVNLRNAYDSAKDVCKRINLTYKFWDIQHTRSKTYIIFLKYEIRHFIISALRQHDFQLISIYLENIDMSIINRLFQLEVYLYKQKKLRQFGILFIILTKVIWRMNNYPRVDK
jgi:glycosyltransferase involved in cell wall biosynthesis